MRPSIQNDPHAGEGAPAHLQFDDNSLLPLLYGEHDRHLARIEQRLSVGLVPRGNLITITGSADARRAAGRALEQLYARLKRGEDLDRDDVDTAIRLASESPGDGNGTNGHRDHAADDLVLATRRRHVAPRSPNQAAYVRAVLDHDLVFGIGPAGTGKTYLAVAAAVTMFLRGDVDRIVLCRPAVEAGERLGFLPGDLKEKVDPYLRPLYDALHDMLPGDQVTRRLANGDIEIAPLAFMRGRTLANAFVIADEAQNTTPMQMKMLLTRLGENSRMVVTGDLTQIDLPQGQASGLQEAVERLADVDGIAFCRFTEADVVRHPLVARIVRAYDAPPKSTRGKRS